MILRGGHETEDPRLDRLIHFDERSRKFPIKAAIPAAAKKPRSYTWRCREWFDQGREGACVGFGIGHELAARPSEITGLGNLFLKEEIYWPAQEIDPWEGGSYPGANPFYEGTSVLSGVKVAQRLGFFTSYHWSFGLNDLILGVGYAGPAVLGLAWHGGMFSPDGNGFIHTTGSITGGHCICAIGVNVKDKYFLLRNSWGKDWGIEGNCKVSFSGMEQLLSEDGEAVFFTGRQKPN